MPKGVTKLLSDGAAKRTDPGTRFPKSPFRRSSPEAKKLKEPTMGVSAFAYRESSAGTQNITEEQGAKSAIRGSRSEGPETSPYDKRNIITRPNAANTRARAAGSLLDRLPKMPKGKKK